MEILNLSLSDTLKWRGLLLLLIRGYSGRCLSLEVVLYCARVFDKYNSLCRFCGHGRLAQLVERELCMLKVVGSIPSSSKQFYEIHILVSV